VRSANRLFTARPGPLLDVAIAVGGLAGSLVVISHGGVVPADGRAGLDPVGVVLAAGATLPLIAWRRLPLGVFVVTAAGSVLLAGLRYPVDLALGPTVALYLLAGSRAPHAAWPRRWTIAVVGLFAAYLAAAAAAHGAFPGVELLHTGLAWSVAWFAGERTRLRRAQLTDLRDRALRAERDAERERLLATAEERARIARDLHDSAGHAVNVIAVRAGAARLRHDPDHSLRTIEAIEELARQTAAEIDHIVGTLRRRPEPVTAPAGLASLDTLIAHHTTAGLRVTVDLSGPPPQLSATADQATYRILQEALTNAARHGTGSARVALTFGDQAVELTVTNPVVADNAPRTGGGHGLIGMRERAALLDGGLDTERTNGTFRVRARIPYGGHRS
jgi:signal transduction histidine kinase